MRKTHINCLIISISIFVCLFQSNIVLSQINNVQVFEKCPTELKDEYAQKDAFKQITDSLFLKKRYAQLIPICQASLENRNISYIAEHNLIAAFYMEGNTKKSDSLLDNLIKKYGNYYFGIGGLLSDPSISMLKYLEIKPNRDKIIEYVVDKYKNENFTKNKTGLKLLKFYYNDQWIRRNSMNNGDYMNYSEKKFKKENRKQGRKIYLLYKREGEILSKKQIGNELYLYQFILLAHDADRRHRKYYLTLIKNGAKNGICEKEKILNFILRTEILQKGFKEFDKTKQARIAELKKEYNITSDYTFGLL